MFWEHEGNAAVRIGKWKLVRESRPWELYDMELDRTEKRSRRPGKTRPAAGAGADMSREYEAWAERCGVIPRERILELMKAQGATAFWEDEDA